MMLLGLIMSAVFVLIVFGPYARFRRTTDRTTAAAMHRPDPQADRHQPGAGHRYSGSGIAALTALSGGTAPVADGYATPAAMYGSRVVIDTPNANFVAPASTFCTQPTCGRMA